MNALPPSAPTNPAAQSFWPTLGLLPMLVASTVAAPSAFAQESAAGGPIVLDAIVLSGVHQDEAATAYTVTEGAAATLTAPLLDTPRTVRVVTQREI